MAGSLQDQLLKMGVVDKKKAKKTQHKKRLETSQKRKAVKSGKELADDRLQKELEQAEREKQLRDRELNKKRDEAAAKKAAVAEIKQIINQHKLQIDDNADIAYNFTHQSKIKKIYVEKQQHAQLTQGLLAIAFDNQTYSLIPDKIAEKIQLRLADYVIRISDDSDSKSDDDPYAGYEIPDDLMW